MHKHTAPADTLLLDHTGARCLSYDSIGRDRTVCLWDLATGLLIFYLKNLLFLVLLTNLCHVLWVQEHCLPHLRPISLTPPARCPMMAVALFLVRRL